MTLAVLPGLALTPYFVAEVREMRGPFVSAFGHHIRAGVDRADALKMAIALSYAEHAGERLNGAMAV